MLVTGAEPHAVPLFAYLAIVTAGTLALLRHRESNQRLSPRDPAQFEAIVAELQIDDAMRSALPGEFMHDRRTAGDSDTGQVIYHPGWVSLLNRLDERFPPRKSRRRTVQWSVRSSLFL